jgi:serine/threonine protein kinase
MFPWADGDSLRDYWVKTPRQTPGPSAELIRQAIEQLRGLADALDCLHYSKAGQNLDGPSNGTHGGQRTIPEMRFHDEHDEETDYNDRSNTKSIRHGDLKPENILRFMDQRTRLGTLKIADMGLAKQHIVATQDRTHLTSTRYGTVQYEAPEAFGELNGPRSRLYDVWSMGCITLEFIIWLLYGNDELNNFYGQLKGDAQQNCQYFELPSEPGARPEVHRVVRKWVKAMQETDPECSSNTALGELLQLVQEKLLIVPLPPNRESSTGSGRTLAPPAIGEAVTRYRATAAELRTSLDCILNNVNRPGYLLAGAPRVSVQLPIKQSSMLTPAAAANRHEGPVFPKLAASQGPLLSGVLGRPIRTSDYALPPLKDWEFSVNNHFAQALTARVKRSKWPSSPNRHTKLCDRCLNLDFWVGGFTFDDTVLALEDRSETCEFCKMLGEVSAKEDGPKRVAVGFERKQSVLLIVGEPFPVLSIFRSLGKLSIPPSMLLYNCSRTSILPPE